MEKKKLYPRTKRLLTFLSYNNFIDDTTFQETLHTLDIIKIQMINMLNIYI